MCQKLFWSLEISQDDRAPPHPFPRCSHSAVFADGDWQVGGRGRKKDAQGKRSPGEEVRKLTLRVREPRKSQQNQRAQPGRHSAMKVPGAGGLLTQVLTSS